MRSLRLIVVTTLCLLGPGAAEMRRAEAQLEAHPGARGDEPGAASAADNGNRSEPQPRIPPPLKDQRLEGQPDPRYLSDWGTVSSYWDGPSELFREFYFTRAFYGSGMWERYRGFPSWSVDFPKADVQFVIGLQRLLSHLDAYALENPLSLTDPQLHNFPFLYAVEVGYMRLTDDEVTALRRYLRAGGFLVVDDFWGSLEWANFEREMKRVFPEYSIEEVPLEHPVFSSFYNVEEIVQVPNVLQGRSGGPTWERDGFVPRVRGIFDDQGRLMVAVNWNCDLGDAWEWAEDPWYPLRFSTYAYQMGVNLVVYAMSH